MPRNKASGGTRGRMEQQKQSVSGKGRHEGKTVIGDEGAGGRELEDIGNRMNCQVEICLGLHEILLFVYIWKDL